MQHSVVQDYDTLVAFPEFMVEVTVFPREMQLHQEYKDPEDATDFFFPELPEELDIDEEEDLCL